MFVRQASIPSSGAAMREFRYGSMAKKSAEPKDENEDNEDDEK
jgi:hypothetical protein